MSSRGQVYTSKQRQQTTCMQSIHSMPLVPLGSSWVNSDTESERRRGCARAKVTSDFMIFPVNCALNLRRFRDCFDRVFAFFYIVKSLYFYPSFRLQTLRIAAPQNALVVTITSLLLVSRLVTYNIAQI